MGFLQTPLLLLTLLSLPATQAQALGSGPLSVTVVALDASVRVTWTPATASPDAEVTYEVYGRTAAGTEVALAKGLPRTTLSAEVEAGFPSYGVAAVVNGTSTGVTYDCVNLHAQPIGDLQRWDPTKWVTADPECLP